ncbi:hypothetical protein N7454_007242 [Penicillium verhagenii]|nr:hypothetical protein N7454_007242 [Penicillium verhagenii]
MLHCRPRGRDRGQQSSFIPEYGSKNFEEVSKEAQRLLSVFTKSSTNLSDEQDLGYSDTVTHGHSVLQPASVNKARRTPRSALDPLEPNDLPPNCSSSESSTTEQNDQPDPTECVAVLDSNQIGKDGLPASYPPIHMTPQRGLSLSSSNPLGRSGQIPNLDISSTTSSSPPPPSDSPLQSLDDLAPRRSGRAKNTPNTYNVRVLLGFELNEASRNSQEVASRVSRASRAPRASHESSPPPDALPSFDLLNKDPTRRTPSIRKLLWDRELRGCGSSNRIHADFTSDIRPWKSWKGASDDVVALAWSPDSTKFAVGATAQPDEYNRKYNLLLGDLVKNELYELPDHWIPRAPSSITTEERLYTSVADMQWAGDRLYTASYDNTVKIWDVGAHKPPTCLQTLRHSSKVVVMALSKKHPKLIATGTDSFHLWHTQEDQDPTCVDLSIVRSSRQKIIDLAPTTLAWGHTASTDHLLVGGMVERIVDEYKVPHYGHLGLWAVGQGSVTPRKLSPDSQNIFDIKWHPFLPKFAAATTYSQAMRLPLKTRTVVQVYDYMDDNFIVTSRFPCPAADVNETSFCPMDSTYITASCTDGQTYVWDVRWPGKNLHQLRHGDPLHPLNHQQPRELTDYGVSIALWGTAIDQFYTGGSDGVLKQWDIRRSPEDVLVANIANFNEGITSGAFSDDSSHLLLGFHGGGIRVLSCGPCSDPEIDKFEFKGAPEPMSEEISGCEASRALVASAEIEQHPIYGPGQGSNYKGPYARWARGLGEDTPLEQVKRIPLKDEYQLRQLSGPKVQAENTLDQNARNELQMQRDIARARNGRHDTLPGDKHRPKGIKDSRDKGGVAASESTRKRKRSREEKGKEKRKKQYHPPKFSDVEVIDLVSDSPEPESTARPKGKPSKLWSSNENLEDGLDDDYWWPDSGCYDANICDGD